MGSPIASMMADIFMDSLENKIFTSNHNLLLHVKYWFRYVDDVLCLWGGSLTELQDFLAFINSFYSKIQFTLEIGGSTINFLDLSITITNGHYDFAIYRKPTYSDTIIHGSSFHPPPPTNMPLYVL